MKLQRHSSQILMESDEIVINLTPLIDVVFVLLIAFIIISPLLQIDRISLAQGRSKESIKEPENGSFLKIYVDQHNLIKINETAIPIDRLIPALRTLKERSNIRRVQLFHDKQAPFGTYQTIKNALEALEFEEMEVLLLPG